MRLTVETGPLAGTRIELDRERPTTIGSGEQCDLRIRDLAVATEHAVVKALRNQGFGVKALTAERLRINGSEVEAAPLHEGDVLELGQTRITYGEPRSTAPPQLPGFKILGRLGRGGMGVVYRAEQVSLHREVALKVLGQELTADPEFVRTFIAEARAAAKLQHPNVVHVFDVGQHDNTYYYTMEVMGHGSLESWLKQHGKMPVERALEVIADAAAGLAYAESLGMVHRDIKPDNLMLDKHGTVKIADLGLARTDQDSEEKLTGTPHFMAPEQLLRKGTDHRTDLYALGCTFYRLVTGRTPFRGKSVKDIVRAQVRERHDPANKWNSDIPADVCAIIDRLLEKSPDDRYQSAQDLLEDVDVLLQPPTRKGLWIGLAAAAVLITTVTIIWAVTRPKETEEVPVYYKDPEAQRLAIENKKLEQRAQEDAATIALLTARLAGYTDIQLANALEAVANAHPGTDAETEARRLAQAARDTVVRRSAEEQRRRDAAANALRALDQRIGEELAADDPAAALGHVVAASRPEDADPAHFAAGVTAARERVELHATQRLQELTEAIDQARQAGDIATLDGAVTTLTAIVSLETGWPAALLPDRPAARQLLDSARAASAGARASAVAKQWRSYRELLHIEGSFANALQYGDLLAAAEVLTTFTADHADSPPAVRGSQLADALRRGASFADALAAAAATGELEFQLDREPARQIRRWDRKRGALVLAASRQRGAADVIVETSQLTPHQWQAFAGQQTQTDDGSGDAPPGRECFVSFMAIQAHLHAAHAYLQLLSPAADDSGTGPDGYPFGTGVFDALMRQLPTAASGWQEELHRELQAGRLLATGLRAMSERRSLAAAAHVDRLLGQHANSIAVAALP